MRAARNGVHVSGPLNGPDTGRECSADLVFASNHDNKTTCWSVHAKDVPNGHSESRRPKSVETSMDDKASDAV